jgi:hypothetical protein
MQRSIVRAAVPLALVAGVVAASPAAAAAKPAPAAHVSGGDVVTFIYPSLVQTRVNRTKRALQQAVKQTENGLPVKAAASLKVVRRQMSSAWRGAKYIIRTTPPPPAAEARVGGHASGVPPVGAVSAAPADSGYLVLTLQHRVAAAMIQLVDGAHGTGLAAISTTLNFANDRRDQAIKDIVALAPPAPPAAARVHAHASGTAPVLDTFDVLMPNIPPQIDDERQAIEGLKSDAPDLTAGGRLLLNDAETQITATEAFVNATWPPIPAEA